jgi:NAD+ kinase
MQENEFDADCDLAIAIGGDGTMLKAAYLTCQYEIPLLGINRGRLGFLADIPADAIEEHLDAIFAGTYVEEERFLLTAEVLREGKSLLKSNAFNDVVLQKWNIARLIELEIYVDGNFVHRQRSDGVIVTTPTGSTAYALSGGGPILHPSLDALALVPICPHTLTNRPIVIDGNSLVEIVVSTREIDHVRLTCDGDITCEVAPGDRVRIQKKDKKIKLIHPQGHDHFSILRAKLQWGTEVC